ncbi:MAG: transcription antitermination factor NusB [Limnochordia bacterium]|jgi:N utilization substance protein B|nr:transcription antitermination factor NusB [Bacillota bacterium]HOB08082.1 transcription antitermination factor NusB [Limnochordia bacterium]MDI9469849.1 transcription antitermination factor NusB [Bacillota bacterium]HPT92445.1 transcription antitermination factor NusB [Limnochordia bacterium]HPZ30223.1 transcription antitermination factor NusB [Limnochordia bacterium]
MGLSRRLARRKALQLLYQIDLTQSSPDEAWNQSNLKEGLSASAQEFAYSLVAGVRRHVEEIDGLIAGFAKDWTIERMSYIDRNILRLAVYELKYMPDTPTKVAVNEAVELAKDFSDVQASKFINGVLGTVVDHLGRNPHE